MKRINGWKRIGIIASFVWMFCGAWYASSEQDKSDAFFIKETVNMEDQYPGGLKATDDLLARLSSPEAMATRRESMAIAAFTPIPFAWGFVFMVLGLARWVKRGFSEAL